MRFKDRLQTVHKFNSRCFKASKSFPKGSLVVEGLIEFYTDLTGIDCF